MEVAHVGAILILLAQIFGIKGLVLLLVEHLSLIIAFELFLAFVMLGILLAVLVDILAVHIRVYHLLSEMFAGRVNSECVGVVLPCFEETTVAVFLN